MVAAIVSAFKWRQRRLPDAVFKFPFKAPAHFEQYQTHIGCRCLFEQPLLSMTIAQSELDLPCEQASATLKWHALAQLQRRGKPPVGFIQYLFALLGKDPNLSLEQTAQLLGLSPATFKRKLKAHHTSFVQLRDRVRHQQAIFDMVELGNSNEQVASSLQFADLTNFRRAFKRWTGMTPSQARDKWVLTQ